MKGTANFPNNVKVHSIIKRSKIIYKPNELKPLQIEVENSADAIAAVELQMNDSSSNVIAMTNTTDQSDMKILTRQLT